MQKVMINYSQNNSTNLLDTTNLVFIDYKVIINLNEFIIFSLLEKEFCV